MVTRILFDPRRDLPGGTTQSNPVTIEATPTGIREDGQVVIYPTTISTPITSGADILQLPANTASNGWRITVRDTITLAVKQQRVVRVPDQASIAYQSLPDIDPASFTVTPGTARQWDATFWALIQAGAGGGLTDSGIAALIGNPASAVAVSLAATYVAVQATAPDPTKITAWVDKTTVPPTVKGWNGTAWVAIGGGGGGGAVSSVAGRTGAVTLTAADVALGNVNNTSDAAKPISTAQAAVNATKADLVGGLVPTSQIPALALNTGVTVASQAAMLALTTAQVQPGDLAIRTDGAGTFILTATDPTQLGNWARLNAPTDVVQSVNGQTGTVVLAKADVGLGSVDNTSDAGKPVSTAQATAIGAKLDAFTTPVTLTAAGTLTANVQNLLDATAGPFTATLPTPTKVGQLIVVERVDASTNLITIGGTIRGVTNVSPTLPGLGATGESITFAAESLTSWRPIASHKPKALLDKQFDAFGAAAAKPSINDVGTALTAVWSSKRTSDQIVAASSTPVFRPIGSGPQPVTGTSPTSTGVLAGGTGVKRIIPAVALKSFIAKWGNFTVGATEASSTATTLSAATTAGATTLTTAVSVAPNSRIVIDTGANTEILYTSAVSGAGPYTITTTTAALFAHASGVAIAVDYGDITIVDATVEYPSGTFTQIYFNGNQSTVMKAGGIVTCDEIALDIPANTPFWIRTNMSWTPGAFVALGGAQIANGQTFGLYNTTPSDKTRLPGSVGGDTLGPTPIAVLGRVAPTVNALLIVGDSIPTGQGDYPDIFRGYVGIATDGVLPIQKICGPSNRAMYDAANATRWRKARLAPGATCALETHGINDITAGGQTLAQLQASKLTIWSWLRSIPGIRNIFTATLIPFTASTDGWMTTASQTISNATFETIRVGINDWIRDGAPVTSAASLTAVAVGTSGALRAGGTGHPLTGYLELADFVEANAAGALTRNGGRWYAPGTIRTVSDAAITSGTKILTSATAAFTSADLGTVVAVNGAGTAGGVYTASISVVTNATTVTLAPASGANAATTVSGATAKIGGATPDGTHPGTPAHTAMAGALTAALPALTA